MSQISDSLIRGNGRLRFKDMEFERAFRQAYIRQGKGDIRRIILIAAALLTVSAPFDVVLIGQGKVTDEVLRCWAIRSFLVIMLLGSKWLGRRVPKNFRSPLLVAQWCIAVLGFGIVMGHAPPSDMPKYLYMLPIASLIITSFLPLAWEDAKYTQLLFFVPVLYCLALALVSGEPIAWTDWALPVFVLAAVIYLGLNSRFGYELAIRENFLTNTELTAARDAAEEADRAKSDFLATISHELRTPLNAILGNIRLLRRTASLDPEPEIMMADAEAAAVAMSRLVEDVLSITSLDIADDRASKQTFRLGEIVEDLEAILGVLAQEKGLQLELPGEAVRAESLHGDSARLRHTLLNLLGNGIKFTRHGRVGLRIGTDRHRVRFLVYDTGLGMPKDEEQRAFDAFFRGSNVATGAFRGAGLGLHIVKRMIDTAGGNIALRSRLGAGTFVYGWLPIRRATKTETARQSSRALPGSIPPLTLLVVEDEPMNMALLRKLLSLEGHEVLEATNVTEALRILEEVVPDGVLTDIRLPDKTGLDLARQMSRLLIAQGTEDVPIFAVTANVLESDLNRYEAAGFDGVIAKPIDIEQLRVALQEIHLQRKSRALEPLGVPIQLPNDFDNLQQIYLQTLRKGVEELRTARQTSADSSRIADVAHRLAGAAALKGDSSLAEAAIELEKQLRSSDGSVSPDIKSLEKQVSEAMRRLRIDG